jgi:hypothetical protein
MDANTSPFVDYVKHGWVLCEIKQGEKAPRGYGWNKRENGITSPERAAQLVGAGLMHAFSGTCAIDIDDLALARAWFAERGINLDELLNADDAVAITRGDSTRTKLLYALPEPLPTKQNKTPDKKTMVVEFRCGATTGNSAQDVLPPTVHPSGKPYAWTFNDDNISPDCRNLPPLPKPLHDLWLSMVRVEKPEPREPSTSTPVDLKWLEELVFQRDADCTEPEWWECGAIISHETEHSDEGYELFDRWSATGTTKYEGPEATRKKWDEIGSRPDQATPATAGKLLQESKATVEDFGPPLDPDMLAVAQATDAAKQQQEHEARVASYACKWNKLGAFKLRPAPEWLVKRIIPRKPLGAIYGPSGGGKSFEMLDIGLAITRGIPWRKFKTRQGSVGWLAAEAEGSMRNRVLAYEKGHGISVDELPFYVLGTGIDLTNRDTVRAIAESAPKGLVMIVVDTLAAAAASANENSGEDMNPVLDNCALIHAITGASVLLVHHSGKDEARGMRGWSGIRARLDYEGEVTHDKQSGTRELAMTKQRDGVEGEALPFKLVPVQIGVDEDGEIETSAYVEHLDGYAGVKAANAKRKGQGKWHRAIRDALSAAPDMELELDALITAAIGHVSEGKRTSRPRQYVIATLKEMVDLGELSEPGIAGTGPRGYGFKVPATVAGSPDVDADILH